MSLNCIDTIYDNVYMFKIVRIKSSNLSIIVLQLGRKRHNHLRGV